MRNNRISTDRVTARDKAYMWLKQAILTRDIAQGQFIVETRVAKELKISRTPIREALQALEVEGLVRLIPGKGAQVTEISLQDLDEVFEFRLLVEQFAIRKIITTRNFSCVPKLKEKLDMQRELLKQANPVAFIAVDKELHSLLVTSADNSRILRSYEAIHDDLVRMGIEAIQTEGRMIQVIAEHEQIVSAIEQEDVAAAEAALARHLESTKQTVARFMLELF